MSEKTKPCPICGEEIKSVATKCIHCGELVGPRRILGKTPWEIARLVVMPLALLLIGIGFNYFASQRQQATDDSRATEAAEVEKDRSQEAALQAYLDRMSELMIEKGLLTSAEGDEIRDIARAQTLMVLRQLDDKDRKGWLVRFLHDAGLIRLSYAAELDGVIVDLSGADLTGANLRDADLFWISLVKADLRKANMSWATLLDANLTEANLTEANLTGALMAGANLSKADLTDANLSEADLSEADLTQADLTGANLFWADLRGADLNPVNLRGADLRLADLSGADLSPGNLIRAKYDDETKWPDGLDPEAAGAIRVED